MLIGSAAVSEPPAEVAEAIAPYQEILGFRLPADLTALPRDPVPEQAATLLRILLALTEPNVR